MSAPQLAVAPGPAVRTPEAWETPAWELAPCIRYDLLPRVCTAWEAKGYDVFAVLPHGQAGTQAFASLLLRKRT